MGIGQITVEVTVPHSSSGVEYVHIRTYVHVFRVNSHADLSNDDSTSASVGN